MAPEDRSIVGDLINFRGLVYAPINEQGVVFLFGRVAHDLNMYVEEIKPGFPDCIARRFIGRGWERVRIEFEFRSSNFLAHKHDPDACDLIVCWEHDWRDCPLEVIELSSEIQSMANPPIEKPGHLDPEIKDAPNRLASILENLGAEPNVGKWYQQLLEGIQAVEPAVWAKVGEKQAGWYSPERAFAAIVPAKKSLHVSCFSRGLPLDGAKIVSVRLSPRWSRLTVKSDADVASGIKILKESLVRLREAIKHAESTSYFSKDPSGNTPSGTVSPEDEDDDKQ